MNSRQKKVPRKLGSWRVADPTAYGVRVLFRIYGVLYGLALAKSEFFLRIPFRFRFRRMLAACELKNLTLSWLVTVLISLNDIGELND